MSQPLTEPIHAVFLSYASQDAEAARRICEALRAGGIEVWFDQNELRGGDAWDQSIRRQIRSCALFIPVISQQTHERSEGYFRLEWKLAVDRSYLMTASKAFLIPVVIDATPMDAEVPERFRELQWTSLPDGRATPAFVEHVRRLLSGETSGARRSGEGAAGSAGPRLQPAGAHRPTPSSSASHAPGLYAPGLHALESAVAARRRPAALRFGASWLWGATAVAVLGVVGYLALERHWSLKTAPAVAPAVPFAPAPHSIAVLPFANLSGDKDQAYFSEGLSEELLDSLARIEQFQVAASTSSFSFQDQHADVATIARKLNVAALLEGSVRRFAQRVRISVQLVNTLTGFQVWSHTYERDLGDILKIQTEIASAVAESLKVTLLGDLSAKIELGGTRNATAFDAYLRALQAYRSQKDPAKDLAAEIAAYDEAIRLDPSFALAYAGRAFALNTVGSEGSTGEEKRASFDKAERDARRALALAPELAEGHMALAVVQESELDFAAASDQWARAAELAPGNVRILRGRAYFSAWMGQFEAAIAAARRAIMLDPIDARSHAVLGHALYYARRFQEATPAYDAAIRLNPDGKSAYAERGFAFYGIPDLPKARASCESKQDFWESEWCLALVYDKLDRHADAQAELVKLQSLGDDAAYQFVTLYAQWGDPTRALQWLETAMRLRDPGLELLKTDPRLDPLRSEPRFQAIVRELRYPD